MSPAHESEVATIAHRFVSALGRADAAAVVAEVADEFTLTIHTAPRGVPRTITGKDELAGMVDNIDRTWTTLAVPRIEVHPFADDPDRALVEYDVCATNHDGSEYRNTYLAVGRVRDGLIVRFDEYYDPAPMVAAIDALRRHLTAGA